MKKRNLIALLAMAYALLCSSPQVFADEVYPNRQLTLIVPFAAGGTTDILARLVAQSISKQFGQPVIIENRAGAGGNLGSATAARSDPDGYTILMGTVGTHAINASLYKHMTFDPVKDFIPLSRVATVPNVLLTNPGRPYKTVQELIDYAKANPGKLDYASSGVGTSLHMSAELFKKMTGVDMLHVIYKGSSPALIDLMGDQVAIMFDNLPSSIQYIRTGKLRAIAVTTAERSAQLPDTPTVAESGLADFEATSWFGLFVPSGTPQSIVDKLNGAIVKALNEPEIRNKIQDIGADPHPETSAEFAAFIQTEAKKWGDVVRASGATME